MKFLKKWITRLLVLVVVLLALLWLGRNTIATASIPAAAKAANLDVTVGKVAIKGNLCGVGITEFSIMNPAGFPEGAMIRVPDLYAECAPLSLVAGTILVRELRVNVAELAIVKNKDGSFNVAALIPPPSSSPGKPKEPSSSPRRDMRIQRLDVKIGTLRFTDLTKNPPTEKTVHIDMHEQSTDVTSPAAVGTYIVTKAVGKGMLAGMTQLGPLLAEGAFSGLPGASLQIPTNAVQGVKGALEGLLKIR